MKFYCFICLTKKFYTHDHTNDTPLRSTDSLVSPGDDNVASTANANEVTETKHNNKNDAAATASAFAASTITTTAAGSADVKGETTSADNDKKKNGSIGDAKENYKFDVSKN